MVQGEVKMGGRGCQGRALGTASFRLKAAGPMEAFKRSHTWM